jgi:hypothetical protein
MHSISFHKPTIRNQRSVIVRSSMLQTISDQSYYIGKFVTLSIGFYCGLQYLHYKQLREVQEKNEEKKDKNNNINRNKTNPNDRSSESD